MSFANLSPLALFGGLAAIAGLLFLLQRLRVRYRPVPVITTLFWREAAEESRARVLVRRFRHPLAYLLVLAIAGLLWFALADPKSATTDATDHVLLLDQSAGMGWSDRFDRAREALLERARTTPPERRTVLACGATIRTLLLPGEPLPLLEERMAKLAVELAPSSIERTLRDLDATRDARTLDVLVFGDAPLRPEVLDLLSDAVVVRRAPPSGDDSREANTGVIALGVTPARSGAWDRVDVLVRRAGSGTAVAAGLDGEFGELAAPEAGADGALLYRDLPAAGGRFAVRVATGDGYAHDDAAEIVLPNRPRIRVGLSTGAQALRPVLLADPAVQLVDSNPAVVVRLAGESIGGGAPALELVDEATQENAFLLIHAAELDSEEVLLDAFDRLGLAEVDAIELAEAARKPISIGASPGDTRAIRIWSSLLGADYDFTRTRSFPLFVAMSLRWLAGEDATPAWVVAGEAVAGTAGTVWADRFGHRFDTLGLDFVPPEAGLHASDDSRIVVASLFDPDATQGVIVGLESESVAAATDGGADLATILAVLALGGLLVEWWMFRTGRMP